MGSHRRSTRQLLLDDLTLVDFDDVFPIADAIGPQVSGERSTTIAVLIVGSVLDAEALRVSATQLARTCAVMVVRVVREPNDDDLAIAGRGVRYVQVTDLDNFASTVRARSAVTA